MKLFLLPLLLLPFQILAQHDEHASVKTENHLNHILACRQQTVYIHDLPPPALLDGIGKSNLLIKTSSETTQKYFNQGVALLHCFWDFEAYRAFKESIRHDSTAIMPYWGLLETIGSFGKEEYKKDKALALKKLKAMKNNASEHEKLYAEGVLLRDSLSNGHQEYAKKLELIVHKFPDDIDAKLFLALNKMSGFNSEMNPNEGHMFSEYLLRDLLNKHPENAAAHHYWIHQMENCCPEKALESADKLSLLAPASGHIVHMPGHIYYKMGDYKKAHDAFVASVSVDSTYMKENGIQEVDNWNFIHNINYLLANCAENGRYRSGLYYALKLQNMMITKERKKTYDGMFFYQGILAPAKMEMRFAFWDKAVAQLNSVKDNDSIYGKKAMAYKEGLTLFSLGMSALEKNDRKEAVKYSKDLDTFLWRNTNQGKEEDVLGWRNLKELNIASLELQGCIKSAEGDYEQALAVLEKAQTKEKELGYSEPPSYVRPILLNIASAHEKAGKFDKAIEAYQSLLLKRPNSANAYFGLANAYRKTGDGTKTKEFEKKLADVTQYGDKDIYMFEQARKNRPGSKR
ncbi:MAG: tetratricopeptide repeat protein [Cyclobacteriaceae bacterium]